MKSFITETFLLHNDRAVELYERFAKDQPIIDYHNHLPPEEIAENKQFPDLFSLWLAGDHYKWRIMRANGIAERFCTGDAPAYEKFLAFARTVPWAVRNPMYHWTHLELKRFFEIDKLLDEKNAKEIWDEANAKLAAGQLRVHDILRANKVRVVCTTDDPCDDLKHHETLRREPLPGTKVYPTYRPDGALHLSDPVKFNAWVGRLEQAADLECRRLPDFLSALDRRHAYFDKMGGRISDHGLPHALAEDCSETEASQLFAKVRAGQSVSAQESLKFGSFMMLFFGRLDTKRGWTKQLHLGPMRNNNTRRFKELGPDTGFDSMGDWPQAAALSRYLDKLDQSNELPKMILYNLNPVNNYLFASIIGNFQDGSIPGKLQFGSGWWFLDQKEGIEWQLNALSNLGLLSRFIGMLTDSRSFLSFSRHEYFRRVLCNLLGDEMKKGELPDDLDLIGRVVRDICFANAADYFGLEM